MEKQQLEQALEIAHSQIRKLKAELLGLKARLCFIKFRMALAHLASPKVAKDSAAAERQPDGHVSRESGGRPALRYRDPAAKRVAGQQRLSRVGSVGLF